MSKIKFDDRIVYCSLRWDDDLRKKKTYFGKVWGGMTKDEANTIAYKTGDGLVVIDVDTQDLDEIDKRIAKALRKLGKPTVTTKRGYHWYFNHNNSEEFVNDSAYTELVDVRSDGGLIFAQYRGKSPEISYKRTGQIYSAIPFKLLKRLRELMKIKSKRKQNRDQWTQAPKGEIHSATLSYAAKDFFSGLSIDEVLVRGIEYVENFLGGTPREMKLMSARIKDAYDYHLQNKLENTKEVLSEEPMEIGGELEDEEIRQMLVKAQKGGALELERVMKEIKKKTKISIATLRKMLVEAQMGDDGLGGFFKGEIVWDGNAGIFAEVRDKFVVYHNKSSFFQTAMSNSGWMTPSDVNERLASICSKRVIYRPDLTERDILDENEDPAINCYRGVIFEGKGKKIPKNINRLLDNLFRNDTKAKEFFIHWLAYIVQFKKKTGVAWGFFGASGTGKGLISDIVMRLVGIHNSSPNVSDADLQSAFNQYAHNKMFLHLNEVASDFHGRHGVAGKMKAFVTDEYLQINMKGIQPVSAKNFTNVILNSNKPNPIELDVDDRRWNMIVTDKALNDCDWFKQGITGDKMLEESLKFGAYLMNVKVDRYKATHIMPKSKVKASIIEQTISPLVQVGSYIRGGDSDGLLEFLQLDSTDFNISEKEIKESFISSRWSSNLFFRIYCHVLGKDAQTVSYQQVVKYMIKPYITIEVSKVSNSLRYYNV